ncbi:MAG: amidohydrolase family protein [Deltaproteobacteria bacterium]|nr:amidohydrolase family protein [Deltaproteobacteria bacterium]
MEISKGLIVSIRRVGHGDLDGHNIVDLSDCTLIPGLVDSHVHLSMSGSDDQEMRRHQLNASFNDAQGLIANHLNEHIAQGVVALRDGGDHAGHTLRYRKEMLPNRKSPAILRTAGRAWHAHGRYGGIIGRSALRGQSLAQAILNSPDDVDHVKIVNSGINSLDIFGKETPPQFDLEQLRKAVQAGQDLGLKTMVHANGKLAVKTAIEAGCHSIEHGYFMGNENMVSMSEKRITWVPTLSPMDAYSRILRSGSPESETAKKNLDHQIYQTYRAAQYGVNIATGTDSGSPGVYHGHAIKEEIRLLISAGISTETAIQCATSNGARLLGLENEIGRLTPGMPATFIVIRTPPGGLIDALNYPGAVCVRGGRVG